MFHRLVVIWERMRTSLWFLPMLMCLAAIALAVSALQVDAEFPNKPWWLNRGDGAQASTLLSSLLSSMITMTTLVVSITMVVLTLAANSLGPRLIRSFMGDRRTQIILGTYVATIVYVFILLRSIDGSAARESVPHAAISIGTALCFVCVCLLLLFVHHLGRSIVANVVIERVGCDLDAAIRRLTRDPEAGLEEVAPDKSKVADGNAAYTTVDKSGYLQAIDVDALVKTAKCADASLGLTFRPGQHFVPNTRKVWVNPAQALTPDLEKKVADALLTGTEPSASNDVEFSVRQLVEIALRALSPGINDPFTAIAVIDRLAISLSHLLQREPPETCYADEDGHVRLTLPELSFAHVLATSFDQIRQASTDKPELLVTLLSAISSLSDTARKPVQRRELARHARMVMEAARRDVRQPDDLSRIERNFAASWPAHDGPSSA